jgi:ActR/RegA family two-component response regulator
MADLHQRDGTGDASPTPHPGPRPGAPLLLVDGETRSRMRLRWALTARGFAVTSRWSLPAALAAAAAMRIVVITAFDSFASVVLALCAGAVDDRPKPVGEAELVDALLGRAPTLPPLPEEPLGAARVCWE